MRGLERETALRLWDMGEGLPAATRAVLLLRAGMGNVPPGEVEQLSIGRRDMELLRLRELTFGSRFEIVVTCGHCGARLECMMRTSELTAVPALDVAPVHHVDVAGRRIEFRLPTSADFVGVESLETEAEVVAHLVARCVLHPPVCDGPLERPTVAAIATRMLELDPQAEVLLDLTCADCGHSGSYEFDITEYFWREIRAYVAHLMEDIDALARAYGWREQDVLALSDRRREHYLRLVS